MEGGPGTLVGVALGAGVGRYAVGPIVGAAVGVDAPQLANSATISSAASIALLTASRFAVMQ